VACIVLSGHLCAGLFWLESEMIGCGGRWCSGCRALEPQFFSFITGGVSVTQVVGVHREKSNFNLLTVVQGTGIKKWYAAGVGWVDFGQNSGTLQPNHTQTENMFRW